MFRTVLAGSLASLAVAMIVPTCAAAPGVTLTEQTGKVRVEINGQHFTDYCFRGAPHVYLYPVRGPGGVAMTRNYPMKADDPGEEKDHVHHRSLWFSHGAVNKVDFWAESPRAGKIVHDKFLEVTSGEKVGVLRAAHQWVAPDGTVVCTDQTTLRFYNRPENERLLDFEITLQAPPGREVVFGDTKEGTMGIRLAETMRLKQNKMNAGKPGGQIVQSTGVRDGNTWGKRAAWCDYSGPVADKTLGVAIFDHPSNPRHPTYWHVRDYGLFAANPFGIHDFEKKPAGTGDLTLPAGRSLTFKYRFYLHEGDDVQAKVAERYEQYRAEK